MTLVVEAHEQCKKCFHFQVCASVLKNDLLIREVMLGEKEPRCKMFVDVVRCKNCKHHEIFDDLPYCNHPRGLAGSVSQDGYCYLGERKDND